MVANITWIWKDVSEGLTRASEVVRNANERMKVWGPVFEAEAKNLEAVRLLLLVAMDHMEDLVDYCEAGGDQATLIAWDRRIDKKVHKQTIEPLETRVRCLEKMMEGKNQTKEDK